MTKDGQYVANNWLTPWELNRIDTDNYGTMLELDENQRRMVASLYLYAKVMVMRVLMAEAERQRDEPKPGSGELLTNSVIRENFKVLASVLYYLIM